MFDPFKDFDSAGYLRNFEGEKNLDIVKMAEHELFRAELPEAVDYRWSAKHRVPGFPSGSPDPVSGFLSLGRPGPCHHGA